MKKILIFIPLVFAFGIINAQRNIKMTALGDSLKAFYLSLHVEERWMAGNHVKWETGEADHPDASSGNHTHCSAFVAAACKKLNIYILRPPEHKQILLANAQYDWLSGADAIADGWKQATEENAFEKAQTFANKGMIVIAICKNPDEKKPGHAALIMPSAITRENLTESGPFVIMAGTHNHNKLPLRAGFKSHLTVWPPDNVLFYYNTHVPQWPD